MYFPRLTGEVRVGFELTVRTEAIVTIPPRRGSLSETRRNSLPVTPGIP